MKIYNLQSITTDDFIGKRSKDELPFECEWCKKIFMVKIRFLKYKLKTPSDKKSFKYCSKKCFQKSHTLLVNKNCGICEKEIMVKLKEFKKSKSGLNFCSHSCAAKYNNAHKTKGTRRSKLEIWIEEQLKILYPKLEIIFGGKKTINSELDIYIPSLKLAFEINGPLHFKNIYGEKKFASIKANDIFKIQACLENKIELIVIDVSNQSYFNEKTSEKYFNIIKNAIN